MKKKNVKKAFSVKKLNVSAKKQKEKKTQKQPSKENVESKKKLDYPDWTKPDHLHYNDHKDLKRFYELYKEQKFTVALEFASNLDTIIRDEIPPEIWKEIGGKLTPKGEETLQNTENNEPEKEAEKHEAKKSKSDSSCSYVFRNGKLQVLNGEYFSNGSEIIEKKFYTKNELEEFISQNDKTLFGETTVFIDNTKDTNEYFSAMFLLNFKEQEKPRMYLIESIFSSESMGIVYARITHFIAYLKNKNYQNNFLVELCRIVEADKEKKKELQEKLKENQDIPELLSEMLENRPSILLIKDKENDVLDLMQAVYVETWGKMVRQILIKKHSCNNDAIYTMNPVFADIWKNGKSKKAEIVKCTEEDHLQASSDIVKNIYNEIKTALLETDSRLEFNPKKHYISIHKGKNLAFLHLRRKSVDIVVMYPEDDTRKQIKHHRIKTLAISVQKFWNGACCTLVIENSDNLNEVISLLKKVVVKA